MNSDIQITVIGNWKKRDMGEVWELANNFQLHELSEK